MKHSAYIVATEDFPPQGIIWKEPFAWDKNMKGTHFTSFHAFISKKPIIGGFRYCVRACTLLVKPPELGG